MKKPYSEVECKLIVMSSAEDVLTASGDVNDDYAQDREWE